MKTYAYKIHKFDRYPCPKFYNILYNEQNHLCFHNYNLFTKELYETSKFITTIGYYNIHSIINNEYFINNYPVGYQIKCINNYHYCYNRQKKYIIKLNDYEYNILYKFANPVNNISMSNYEDLIYAYYSHDINKFCITNNENTIKIAPINNFDISISPNGKTGAYLKNRNRVVLFDTQNFAIKSEFKINSAYKLAFDNENMILSCIGTKYITEIDLD